MKVWFKSKTLWFNVAGGVLGVFLNALQTAPLDPQIQVLILTIGNAVLRMMTTEPIGSGT